VAIAGYLGVGEGVPRDVLVMVVVMVTML